MATVTWLSAISGDWSTAADWSTGAVPGSTDDVIIRMAGTYVVTVDQAEATRSLAITASGATLDVNASLAVATLNAAGLLELGRSGTLSVTGPATLRTVEGPGTLLTSGTTTTTFANLTDGSTWINTGTIQNDLFITLSYGADQASSLINAAGGTIDATSTDTAVWADPEKPGSQGAGSLPTLTNAGLMEFSAGGVATIQAVLDNTGTLALGSVLLGLTGGGTIAGQITESNGRIQLDTGTYFLSASTSAEITNEAGGTLELATSLTGVVMNNGVLALDAPIEGLEVLYDYGTVDVGDGTLTAAYCEIAGAILGNGGTLVNADSADVYYSATIGAPSSASTVTILNESQASCSMYGGSLFNASASTTSYFDNEGDLYVATATIDSVLTNAGTVVVQGPAYFASLVNLSDQALSGGAYYINSQMHGAEYSVQLELGADLRVITDDADIRLRGTNATIQSLDTATGQQVAIDATLASISADGTLELDVGRAFDAQAPTLTVGGWLHLERGASYSGTALEIGKSGLLSGSGTVSAALQLAGTVRSHDGTLTLAGAVSGDGHVKARAQSVLALDGGGNVSATLTGEGMIRIRGASTLTLTQGSSLHAATIDQSANVAIGAGSAAVSLMNESGHLYVLSGRAVLSGVAGSSFTNAGSLSTSGVDTIELAFIDQGSVGVNKGTLSFLGAVTENGVATAAGSLVYQDKVSGSGTIAIAASGAATLLAGSGAGLTAAFLAASGALDLAQPLAFAGAIDGFAAGDTIDLAGTKVTSHHYADGILTVKEDGSPVGHLHFAGSYAADSFHLGSDGHGGTAITHT